MKKRSHLLAVPLQPLHHLLSKLVDPMEHFGARVERVSAGEGLGAADRLGQLPPNHRFKVASAREFEKPPSEEESRNVFFNKNLKINNPDNKKS